MAGGWVNVCAPVLVGGNLRQAPLLRCLPQVGLYHYAIKSLDDFIQKMARGSGMGNVKTIAFFEVCCVARRGPGTVVSSSSN